MATDPNDILMPEAGDMLDEHAPPYDDPDQVKRQNQSPLLHLIGRFRSPIIAEIDRGELSAHC